MRPPGFRFSQTQHSQGFANPRHGFTLVEILVTALILGVLIALMFPAFVKLKDVAARAKCTSNLRLLGTASTHLFAERNWNKIVVGPSGNWTWWGTGADSLAPYLPSQIFAKSTGGVPNGAEIFQPADLICPALARMDNTGPFAYYVNNSGVTFNSTKTIPSLMPWPASKVALFMDGGRGNRNNRTFPLTQAQSDYIKPSNPAVLGFPHSNNPATCYKAPSTGGKMNVVFLDGHIQMMDRDIGPFDNNFWCSEKAIK